MPFKLKLKRTKRYEVSSKNAFVVGVHMLDNSFLECTLSSDSKGGECLDSISQRIDLAELQYFGLRYVTKKLQFRWVDLEKPLKKQLDKFAHSPRLYFGVLYYVASAHKMLDAVARYQYFLQLKTDIIDGRLPCTPEQAVRFAAYSLQAEFGDHDPERYTAEHFKDYLLLPKTMTKDEATILELTKEILNAHRCLLGVPVVKAEIQYIKEVQLLDGYGMEYYLAKDSSGKELYLGTSYAGVFARHLDGQPVVFFKWTEIANVSQSKKTLEIDTSKSSVQYQLEDPDTAKYLCRICHLQQKFYKSNKNTLNSSLSDVSIDNEADLFSRPDIQQTVPPQTDIPDVVGGRHYSASKVLQNADSQGSTYAQDLRVSHEYQQQQLLTHEDYISQSQQSLDQVLPDVQQHYIDGGGVVINEQTYGQPDLQVQQQHPPNQADPTYEIRLAALPAYRPAPDYESVMRHRLLQQTVQQQQQQDQQQQQQVLAQPDNIHLLTGNLGNAQVYSSQAQTIAYSQPEIRTSQYHQHEVGQFDGSIYANVFPDSLSHSGGSYLAYRSSDRATSQIIHPTYSTPELHSQLLAQHYSTENVMGEALSYMYKPPPPYPRASNSTPDLAIQTVKSNLSESPDLVSRRNLGMQADLIAQSRLDRSVENLAEDFQNLAMLNLNMDANSAIHMKPIVPSSELSEDRSSLVEEILVVESSYHTTESVHVAEITEEDKQRLLSSPQLKQQSAQRLSGRSHQSPCEKKSGKIQIKYMAPGQAPPHSSSAEVATRRESFRRQMIANTPYMEARNSARRSLQNKDVSGKGALPTISDNASSKLQPQLSTQSEVSVEGRGDNPGAEGAEMASCKEVVHQTVSGDSNTSSMELDRLSLLDDGEQDIGPPMFHMGPLKTAAMNGLTVSQPSMLAALNDETRAPKDDRRKNLENQLEEGRVFVEFEKVFRRDPAAEIKMASENESRNRFRDVLPYEHNRVKLTPKKDNPAGYINASHIKLDSGGVDWWFIAAQAPMPNTVGDFWQMVWEYKIHVIAMLTDIVELGKQKCCQYWPSETGEENKAMHGEYEVVLQYRSNSLYYVTHTICVRHKASKSERHVWHLQYITWPDHGCPEDIFGFLGFLDEVESVQRMAESDLGGAKFPIIVHCSAGVGRTGMVILTTVMKSFLEHNQSIDLAKALASLRGQRMYMVQTVGQYSFVYKTLIQYLKNTRLI